MTTEYRKPEILPDSRLKHNGTPKGRIFTPMGTLVPVYCVNCGKDGGLCYEENTTYLFYLCDPCFERWKPVLEANFYVMPDEIFWQKMKDEQMEKYGRLLSKEELAKVVAEDASPLATLINGRKL